MVVKTIQIYGVQMWKMDWQGKSHQFNMTC